MLDFTLMTQEERVAYVNAHPEDIAKTPNGLKTVADYILFPDPAFRESKTWYKKPAQSLDAIIEEAGDLPFNDHGAATTKVTPANMSVQRESFRKRLSPTALEVFTDLWNRIDTLDLQICYATKGEAPLRLKAFADAHPEINADTCKFEPYTVLKKKRLLVELRREQYTIKDDTAPFIALQTHSAGMPNLYTPFDICDIEIGPISPADYTEAQFKRILRPDRFPIPEDALREMPQHYAPRFDFTNKLHLQVLIDQYYDLRDALEDAPIDSNLHLFLYQWETYVQLANLTPITTRLLELKYLHWPNAKIADDIDKNFNKTYGANYISTLYHNNCLGEIIDAIKYHSESLADALNADHFKKCRCCGQLLRRDNHNFSTRSRSTDNFATICKRCDKIKRDQRNAK